MTKKNIKALARNINSKFRKPLPGSKPKVSKSNQLKDGVISFF